MKHGYTFVLGLLFFLPTFLHGQSYCSPTFANDCFNWNNMSIAIGDIAWAPGGNACTVSDYTSTSTYIGAGISTPMTVTNGVWCGCTVWVDLDQSLTFEDSENLYYNYVGGAPSYTYNFSITVPPGTPTGDYRMRVVAAWGSDGFSSTNQNGFGPCGDFQYGNFQDFTLNVDGSTGTGTQGSVEEALLTVAPNPATDMVMVMGLADAGSGSIQVLGMDGRVVLERAVPMTTDKVQLDLGSLPGGAYTLRGLFDERTRTARFIKD